MRTLLAVVLLFFCACASWLPAPVPMRSVSYARPGGASRCLLVLLPGAGDHAEEFARQGFVEAVRARGISADVVAADATAGYYFKGIVWERLRADVIEPWRARGYEEVWLAGISMGGMGALMTSERHPELVGGLVLIAPFLGDEALAREIQLAGGLARWDPGALPKEPTEDTYPRHVWRWLKQATSAGSPAIYLGFGEEDRFAPSARVLAAALPPERVFTAPGGHDWPPWRAVWAKVLERLDSCATSRATPPAPGASR